MKALILGFGLILSFAAQASQSELAFCYGDHHGTYVDFHINPTTQLVYIETSTDGDETEGNQFNIISVKNYDTVIPEVGRSWAIRQAIRAAKNQDDSYKEIVVKAMDSKGSVLYVQLNKVMSHESFLSQEGRVEKLTCDLIRE